MYNNFRSDINIKKFFFRLIMILIITLIMQLLTFNVNHKRNIRFHINSIIKIVLISINQIDFNNHNRFSNYKQLKSLNYTQKICHKINNKINRVKLNLLLLQFRNI